MLPDPLMKRNYKRLYVCAQEGCDNYLNVTTIKNLDPFCSTKCCHEFHGVEIQLPGRGTFVASTV